MTLQKIYKVYVYVQKRKMQELYKLYIYVQK